ncbi:serine-type peptidase [Aureococcus anophagefferens]|nr:serine-type peptidase [Aureococcus anophagefferens]
MVAANAGQADWGHWVAFAPWAWRRTARGQRRAAALCRRGARGEEEHATTAHAACAVAPKFFYREFRRGGHGRRQALPALAHARCHANYPPPRAPKRLSRTNIDEGGAIAEIRGARFPPPSRRGAAARRCGGTAERRGRWLSPGRALAPPGAAAAARASPRLRAPPSAALSRAMKPGAGVR